CSHGLMRSRAAPGNEAVLVNISKALRPKMGDPGAAPEAALEDQGKTVAGRSKTSSHDSKPSGHLLGFRRSTGVWWSGGSVWPHVLRYFCRSPRPTSGFIN